MTSRQSRAVMSAATLVTLLGGSAFTVDISSSYLSGSNFDGVDGEWFLRFGTATDKGSIRFEIPTVPGGRYTLSYHCGATDSWTFDQLGIDGAWRRRFGASQRGFHAAATDAEKKDGAAYAIGHFESSLGRGLYITDSGCSSRNRASERSCLMAARTAGRL